MPRLPSAPEPSPQAQRRAAVSMLFDLAGKTCRTTAEYEQLADKVTALRDAGTITESERSKYVASFHAPKPQPTVAELAATKQAAQDAAAARAESIAAAKAADKLVPFDNTTDAGRERISRAWGNI
jgi:hypothetical protein